MILETMRIRKNNKSRIFYKIKCDCGYIFEREKYTFQKIEKRNKYSPLLCKKCITKIVNSSDEYKINMSKSINKMYNDNPNIREKKRKSMYGKNKGSNNGMKKLEARKKVSNSRKKMFEDIELRKEYSLKTKKAWEDGKFDNVKVGQCKWFEYKSNDGKVNKVQGTWELAFIKWLDYNNLTFTCHRGRIPYQLHDKDHNYYPDFYVEEWDSYVDVKAKYFFNKEKFDAIVEQNDINLKILFKDDLIKLGVEL